MHGTDLLHPRTRVATAAVLPAMDLLAVVSASLLHELPYRSARRRAQVLPCGVNTERFRPLPREQARAALGLDPERPYVLFPADSARAEKRYDRAQALCAAAGVQLLALGGVAPDRVPLWVNAANVVVVPSEREGFGLAVLEALACEVPVLATPVGIHEEALAGVEDSLCAPFDITRWGDALRAHLSPAATTGTPSVQRANPPARLASAPAARLPGARASAMRFSAERAAARVAEAWGAAVQRSG
jgi:teichuronic acid biosynthesis glycosyltransferase TuaC